MYITHHHKQNINNVCVWVESAVNSGRGQSVSTKIWCFILQASTNNSQVHLLNHTYA